jgi:hypothetical protein
MKCPALVILLALTMQWISPCCNGEELQHRGQTHVSRSYLSRPQLKELLHDHTRLLLVAVMNQQLFQQSHLPQAIWTTVVSGPGDVARNAAQHDMPIVIYGTEYSDANPATLSDGLREAGYTDVRVYSEGLRGLMSSDVALEGTSPRDLKILPRTKRLSFHGYNNPLAWPFLLLLKPKD